MARSRRASHGWTHTVYGQGLPYPRRDQQKCGDGKPSPYSLVMSPQQILAFRPVCRLHRTRD